MNDKPGQFGRLWATAREQGMFSGLPTTVDPFSAACWYHQGVADMALEFARGHGPTLQKLEQIRIELARLADSACERDPPE